MKVEGWGQSHILTRLWSPLQLGCGRRCGRRPGGVSRRATGLEADATDRLCPMAGGLLQCRPIQAGPGPRRGTGWSTEPRGADAPKVHRAAGRCPVSATWGQTRTWGMRSELGTMNGSGLGEMLVSRGTGLHLCTRPARRFSVHPLKLSLGSLSSGSGSNTLVSPQSGVGPSLPCLTGHTHL